MSTPSWPSLYNPGIELINIEHNAPVQPSGAYLSDAIDIFRFTLYWTLIFYCPVFILCGFFAFWNLNFPPALRSSDRMNAGNPTQHPLESSRRTASRRRSKRARPKSPSEDHYYPLSPLNQWQTTTTPEPLPPPPKPSSSEARPSTSASFPTGTSLTGPTPQITPIIQHALHAGTTPSQTTQFHGQSATLISNPPSRPSAKRKYKAKQHKRSSRFVFAFLVLLAFLAAGLAGAVLTAAILGFTVAAFFRSVDFNMSTWIPFLLAFISSFVGYLSLWPSVIDII